MRVNLVRDLLDNQVNDTYGEKLGRVDSVVLDIAADGSIRVAGLEMGGALCARRVSKRLVPLAARMRSWWGTGHATPTHIEWSQVVQLTHDVETSMEAERAPNLSFERWLRLRVARHIPTLKK